MDRPLMLDAHLDLSMNAMEWNRDLRWSVEDILGYITKMISTLMSGICVTAILGRFWKRATWQGAIAAFISGSVISLIIFASTSLSEYFGNPIIPSLAGAALAHVIVSFASPMNEVSAADALEMINNERKAMDL